MYRTVRRTQTTSTHSPYALCVTLCEASWCICLLSLVKGLPEVKSSRTPRYMPAVCVCVRSRARSRKHKYVCTCVCDSEEQRVEGPGEKGDVGKGSGCSSVGRDMGKGEMHV